MISLYKNLYNKKDSSKLQKLDNLSTERLSLKLMQKDDLDEIVKNMTEETVNNLGGGMTWPFGKKDAEDWLKRSLEAREKNDFYNYIMRTKDSGEFVGMITAFVRQYYTCLFPGKVSYWTAEKQRRKGYVLEALAKIETLYQKYFELQKIWTTVRAENPASSNLLLKSGFKKTGSRWETYKNNEYLWEHIFEKDIEKSF
jgi:ribosomal-protein-alanine N-acetyltransferase